jgi:cell division protein FtsL
MSPRVRALAPAEQREAARSHRESDRRRLRAMAGAVLGAGLVVALVLGVVGLRVQQVRLSYRLEALRAARADVEETNRRLRVELAMLRSPARIEGKARNELGMTAPSQQQVRLAREFVPGASGGAAGGGRQTVLVERQGAAAPRIR